MVEGAAENHYCGTFPVASVGYKTLTYAPTFTPGFATASGVITVRSAEPLNLIAQCVRPNGMIALVVGTKTNLFRFFPNDGDPYVEDDYWADDYVDDTTAGWLVIGSGYSPLGRRWEAEDSNGYLVLNNGVDLMCTYRVEEFAVVPVYELRESGFASVGTIATYNMILNGGDTREFKTEDFLPWMLPTGTDLFPGVTASQTGTTVTFTSAVAAAGDVGKFIEYSDGVSTEITGFTDAQTVTVADSLTKDMLAFKLKTQGGQTGAYSSITDGGKLASLVGSTMVVTLSAAPATAGVLGDVFRFANGFESIITAVNSTIEYVLTLADDPGENFSAQVFWISNDAAHGVVSGVDLFTEDMVGQTLYFENGETRVITEFGDAQNVVVDGDGAVTATFVSVDNPAAYGRVEDDAKVNRIHWNHIWGEIEQPRRWASAIPCEVTVGSREVVMDYPALSLEAGQEIIILGAGVDGANVTATILSMAGNRFLTIDQDVATTMATELQQVDALGGLTGQQPLQDDGSGILKMMVLQDTLVIYKDTSIFLCNYTGDVNFPFATRRRRIPPNTGLYFRNTLITYEENWHIYAGRTSFYRFNLTDQVPQVLPSVEGCREVFFTDANRAQSDLIYAADNALTKETWFCFPHGADDGCLIMDQLYGTISTSDRRYNALATVTRPTADAVQGESDALCLAALGERLLIYGLANISMETWDGAREIFHVRDQYPFAHQKLTYSTQLDTGLDAFGNADTEKNLLDYVLFLSSWSEDCPVTVTLFGAANPTNEPEELDRLNIDKPTSENQFPTLIRDSYFADRIEVEARGQKVSLSARQYRVLPIGSRSANRSPGDF